MKERDTGGDLSVPRKRGTLSPLGLISYHSYPTPQARRGGLIRVFHLPQDCRALVIRALGRAVCLAPCVTSVLVGSGGPRLDLSQ